MHMTIGGMILAYRGMKINFSKLSKTLDTCSRICYNILMARTKREKLDINITEEIMGTMSTANLSYIPTDEQDLYLHYMVDKSGPSVTKRLVKTFLPYAEDDLVETLVHDVFLRFVSSNMMAKFDAAKANFGGAIFFVTRTICANYLNRKTRDPLGDLRKGSLVEASEEFEMGSYTLDSMELEPAIETINEDKVSAKFAVEKLLRWAEEKKMTSTYKNKRDQSLGSLIKLLLEGNNPQECADTLNVTASTIHSWIKHIRETGPFYAF